MSQALPQSEAPTPDSALTPALAQYFEAKRAHGGALLFYRMGDFYELFFDDAVAASAALDIALTKRGQYQGRDIPMCGVPAKAADAYLSRLVRKGFKVAICEQMEDPAEARRRGSKSVVRRQVVRVVTPGTITEDALLDARANNYLAALAEAQGGLALAWLDISTGDFQLQPLAVADLAAVLARLSPGEIVVADRLLERADLRDILAEWTSALTPLPSVRFDSENARRRLQALYGVGALDAFGDFGRPELAAAGALIDYVELTQVGRLPRLGSPRRVAAGAVMDIDAATRRNLELTASLAGERLGSLLAAIDRTVTGAGARELAAWLAAPLTDSAAIAARQDCIAFFLADAGRRQQVRAALSRAPDMARALSRLSLGRGGPRDLAALGDGLSRAEALKLRFAETYPAAPPPLLVQGLRDLGHHAGLVERLGRALGPDLPLLARDGGFIAPAYAAELDELRALSADGRQHILALEARYKAETGIQSLKIRHNNVLGFYVEATPAHADKLTQGANVGVFIHRQSLASAMRFTTVELGELEVRIASAADRALALELALFADLVAEVLARAEGIAATARALALLDVTSALAELAEGERYARPLVDDSLSFGIEQGRHPVVEQALRRNAAAFVPNDCDLGQEQRLWLVTGPNMAGKSTFLRQNALIAVLAQIGSYVPAASARIGVVDRLFSRVGAADDLARGRSTFMVEMVETAAILNQAGPRALVILDEIGRGTATFDGLSIAWACVEYLHDVNRARALFATHYHELNALTSRLPALSAHAMRVKEWQGRVVFLHEVAPGAADRSYGIHVAQLAGLPAAAVARAEEVLRGLEAGEQAGALARLADDLPLFSAAARPGGPGPKTSSVEEALRQANADALSPREALDLVYRLRALLPE